MNREDTDFRIVVSSGKREGKKSDGSYKNGFNYICKFCVCNLKQITKYQHFLNLNCMFILNFPTWLKFLYLKYFILFELFKYWMLKEKVKIKTNLGILKEGYKKMIVRTFCKSQCESICGLDNDTAVGIKSNEKICLENKINSRRFIVSLREDGTTVWSGLREKGGKIVEGNNLG